MSTKIEDVKYMRAKLNEVMYFNNGTEVDSKLYDECMSILITIGSEGIYELKDEVYKLLNCDDQFIRDEAVTTLGSPNRLHLPEFRDMAYDIWLNDSSDMVRSNALSAWCGYYRESKNKDVLKRLYSILANEGFSIDIKVVACCGIFSTVSFNHPAFDQFNDVDKLLNCETNAEFNSKVNWDAIRDIMRQYAPEALKDDDE